jgi:hypothetical protein
VTKLNPAGSALVYSTYIGGAGTDEAFGLALDSQGAAYVTGQVCSFDFPTTSGAYQTAAATLCDAFVTKLNAAGSALAYSTFLGGTDHDGAGGIALDGSLNAYVTGFSYSTDYPVTAGAYDTSHNGAYDAFVSKLNAAGSALDYSTFLGGSGGDEGREIAVDSQGNAYAVGLTDSPNYPTTPGAYDTTYGGVALDGQANAYVTGYTGSADYPVAPGAYDVSFNGGTTDAFLTKLNSGSSAVAYSTFVGGSGNDIGWELALDTQNNAYLTGSTLSAAYPTTPGAYDTLSTAASAAATPS